MSLSNFIVSQKSHVDFIFTIQSEILQWLVKIQNLKRDNLSFDDYEPHRLHQSNSTPFHDRQYANK